MAKVKLDLKSLSIPEKVEKIRQIVKALTGNSNFPTPQPALATLTALANDLEVAYNDAQASKQATTAKISLMHTKEDAAEQGVRQATFYVESVAGDDEDKILSAGLSLRSAATQITQASAPTALAATEGDHERELDLSHNPVKGAKSYEYQQSPDPPTATSWVHAAISAKSSATISGLTSGTRYWFRVRAITSGGATGWSDPATKIAP
jgi:hypothetical protein